MEEVIITINASGKRFEIKRSCLKNGPEKLKSLLQPSLHLSAEKGKLKELTIIMDKGEVLEHPSIAPDVNHFNPGYNFSTMVHNRSEERPEECFIARNPDAFGAVVDYCMTGELHMPPSICAGVFHREMDYWGLDCHRLEPCCHGRYDDYQEENRILKAIYRSEERSVSVSNPKLSDDHGKLSTFRKNLVTLLDDPTISRFAKIYFWIGMAFVFISLFVLCAGSHKLFQVALNEDQWKDYLGEEFERYSHHFHQPYHHSPTLFPDDNVDPTIGGTDGNEREHLDLKHPNVRLSPNSPEAKTDDDDPLPLNAHVLHSSLRILDNISVGFFTVDLIIRFLLSYQKRRFFCSFLNVIDLVCLLPYYIIWIIETLYPRERYTVSDFDLLYAFTVVRVFRIFRLSKESLGLRVFILSCAAGVRGVGLLLMFLGIGCLIFASLVYFAEAQTKGNDFTSIPASCWWALVTMTTVGYGDMIPETFLGKMIGSFAVVSGVLVVAITVPVLSNSFNVFYRQSLKLRRKKLGKLEDGFVQIIKIPPIPPIIEKVKH